MIGIRTWACRMVGTNRSSELWRPQLWLFAQNIDYWHRLDIMNGTIIPLSLMVYANNNSGNMN